MRPKRARAARLPRAPGARPRPRVRARVPPARARRRGPRHDEPPLPQGASQDPPAEDAGAGALRAPPATSRRSTSASPPRWPRPRPRAASSAPTPMRARAARSASRSASSWTSCCTGDYKAAAAKMREDNVLPAVTGRVCPQEDQCEGACVMGKKFDPAGHRLPRAVHRRLGGGVRRARPARRAPRPPARRWPASAAAPPSLTVAGDLVQKGHDVTVFEALHEIGGVLVYGIPEFRLPKDIVQREVGNMEKMGVGFETNVVVGRTVTIDELMRRGRLRRRVRRHRRGPAEVPRCPRREPERRLLRERVPLPRQPDEGLPLPRVRRARSTTAAGKSVAVIGGGNTALDAIRTVAAPGRRPRR